MPRSPKNVQSKKGSGSRRAYDDIRSQILSLQLPPGTDFDEQDLVRSLGLSRTPIREALIQLSAEGLVEILPNRGARVARIDLAGVREFFEALDANQRMVSRWAAVRRSKEQLARIDGERIHFEAAVKAQNIAAMTTTNLAFHEAIGAACGNTLVAKQYSQLLGFGIRLSRLSLAYEGDTRDDHIGGIVDEHQDLFNHLVTGNADAAEAVARIHTDRFRARVLEFLKTNLSAEMKF